MIKVDGKYLLRSGEKIGSILENDVFDHEGEKVGYYRENDIFDKKGKKLAYIQDNKICFIDSVKKIRIEENNEIIIGGSLSNLERAAVRILLGE